MNKRVVEGIGEDAVGSMEDPPFDKGDGEEKG
jgi:hypothetical protein